LLSQGAGMRPEASATGQPNPSAIMQMATGYWASATLFAANRLDLFALLATGPFSAAQAAEHAGADLRGITLLLDACCGLGLLVKEADEAGRSAARYRNTPAADAFLVAGRPGYLGGALRWSADQFGAWGALADSVRLGMPAVQPSLHLGDDPEQTRNFVLGMHHRALGVARGVIPFLRLDGVRRLLDVGGGPGTYATLLAQRYPDLTVDVLDLPAVVAIARELVVESGLSERVRIRAGDATTDDYGIEEYDAVLFSGVLHQMPAETILSMLGRAAIALCAGGTVWISDMMLGPDKTEPPFSTLFSLQMLLTSAQGAVFSTDECLQWLEQSGFTDVTTQSLPPPLPYVVVTAARPESR
jgi:SAM-dependent methyltransferase